MRNLLDDEPRNHLRLVDLIDDPSVDNSPDLGLKRQRICLYSLSNDKLHVGLKLLRGVEEQGGGL